MKHSLDLKKIAVPVKIIIRMLLLKINAFSFILLVFVAVAVTQSIQLGDMLSETKNVGKDVNGIRSELKILSEEHSLRSNQLSHKFSEYNNGSKASVGEFFDENAASTGEHIALLH